jgi:hypothetical protein
MGPPIYDCPGILIEDLPWRSYYGGLYGGDELRTATLLINSCEYSFRQREDGTLTVTRYNCDPTTFQPQEAMEAMAYVFELTKGKMVQDPNGTGWEPPSRHLGRINFSAPSAEEDARRVAEQTAKNISQFHKIRRNLER